MVGKSVSHHHHHRHSAVQRTEKWRAYGDPRMMEMDWAMAGVQRYSDDGDRRGDRGCMQIQG